MQNNIIEAKIVYFTVISACASSLSYLNIDSELLSLYSLLMLFDLLTGIAAASIRREDITKARLTAGILSKLIMFAVPISVAILVKMQGANFELAWFTKWTLLVLGASEAISIFNNVLKAKGQKTLPEFDAISVIASKIRDILEKLFNKGDGNV